MTWDLHCEKKPCILLVDDKPQNLFALKKLLDNSHYDVMTAICGNDALALALEHDFSVILMDAQMPGMSGFETARLLSLDDATKNIPIIFVTAHQMDNKYMKKGYSAGAVDYLSKPINPEVLKGKINVFLALNQEKNALEKTNKELEQANRDKSDFLGRVGDEIRTPLFGVIGLAGRMAEQGLTPEQNEMAVALQEQASNLLTIINSLFDYSNVSKEQDMLRLRDFNLNNVVRDVDYVLGLRAREKQLTYHCAREEKVPNLLVGDSTRLRQVILTMVTNGVRLARQGDISVYVEMEENREDQIVLKFSVIVTRAGGPGPWQDKALSIFENFTPRNTDASFECPHGSELDLVVARQLVEAMGGKTGVEKDSRGGVGFWFTALFTRQMPKTLLAQTIQIAKDSIAMASDDRPNSQDWARKIIKDYQPVQSRPRPVPTGLS